MPTLNAGQSTVIPLPAGKIITGTGAGQASWEVAGFQSLTQGDPWQIGPFPIFESVSMSATTSAISCVVRTPGQSPVQGDGRGGIVLNGDSIFARTWQVGAPASAPTQTGGVATHVVNSHGLMPGHTFFFGHAADPLWNREFTVATVTDVNTFTTAIDPRASATAVVGDYPLAYLLPSRTPIGFVSWLESFAQRDYSPITVASRGSRELSEQAADFDQFVAPNLPAVYLHGGGTNDALNAVPLATSAAADEEMVRKALALGASVIIFTVPPLGATSTDAQVNAVMALNVSRRALAARLRVQLFDLWALWVAPTTGRANTAYIDPDNVHFLAIAYQAAAAVLEPMIYKLGAAKDIALPVTTSDLNSVFSGSNNIFDGFFAGVGGNEAGGALGDTATGWTLTATGLAVTGSKGTPTPAVGASQILTITAASGQSLTLAGPSIHASIAPGDRIQLLGQVDVSLSDRVRLGLDIRATPTGGTAGRIRAINSFSAAHGLPAGTYTMVMQSEIFTVPAGASYTAFTPTVQCNFDASTTGTLAFSRFAVRKLGPA